MDSFGANSEFRLHCFHGTFLPVKDPWLAHICPLSVSVTQSGYGYNEAGNEEGNETGNGVF